MKGYLLALVAIAFVLSIALPCLSQVPAVAGSLAAVEEVAQPAFLDKIIEAIKNAGGLLAGLVIAFEVGLRLFPTAKPLSILIPVKYGVDGVVVILGLLSQFLQNLISVANKTKAEKKA